MLLYLLAYEKGYAKEISRTFGIPLNMVQKQLAKFEAASVLVSQKFGSVRLFSWNPRWPFLATFRNWLQEVMAAMPAEMKSRYYSQRNWSSGEGGVDVDAKMAEFELRLAELPRQITKTRKKKK